MLGGSGRLAERDREVKISKWEQERKPIGYERCRKREGGGGEESHCRNVNS